MQARNSETTRNEIHEPKLLAILLPDLRGGGAERVAVNLANAFVDRGIDARVASELIASVAGKKSPPVTKAAGLTFGQYVLLLEKPEAWSQFGCPLSQEIFCARLDKVRCIRNQVMHFDPDGLNEADLRLLATFSGLVRGLG